MQVRTQWSFEVLYAGPQFGASVCDLSFPSPALDDSRLVVATAVHGPHDLQSWISHDLREIIRSESWDGMCASVPDWFERTRLRVAGIGHAIESKTTMKEINPVVTLGGAAFDAEGQLIAFRRGDFEVLVGDATALKSETVAAHPKTSAKPVAVLTSAFPRDRLAANDFVWCDPRSGPVIVQSLDGWLRLTLSETRS